MPPCAAHKYPILTPRDIPYFVCFVLVGYAAYANALDMDFIGDDIGRIQYNLHFFHKGFFSTLTHVLPDRPFLMATIWLNFKLWGMSPIGFKVVDVALHGVTGFALWTLMRCIFGPQHQTKACLITLLFIVHPIHNQAVNSIIQRGAILSALTVFLSVLSFVSYLKSSSRPFFLLSLLFFVLGLLSKTNAVVVPFILLAYLYFIENMKVTESVRLLLPFFPFLLIPGIFYYLLHVGNQSAALPWLEYLSMQSSVIFMYLQLLFIPSGLHFSYRADQDLEFLTSFTWLTIIGHCSIFLALYLAWSKKESLLVFSGVAAYICFLPESGLFPIADIAFEHRTYLPFMFLSMIVLWAITKIHMAPFAIYGAISVVTLVFFLLNIFYNETINTYEKWVSYNVAKNPRDHNFNLYNLDELFLRNSIDTGTQLIHRLIDQYPEDHGYKVFQQMYSYGTRNGQDRQDVVHSLTRVLTDESVAIDPVARLAGTRFAMRRLPQFSDPHSASLAIDDLVYSQLDTFLHHGRFFSQIYLNYLPHLEQLKTHYEARSLTTLDRQQTTRYLRGLAILELYYNDDIPDLEQRFHRALKRFPESVALRTTFDWFTSQEKKPLLLSQEDSVLLRLK